jgi:hypothetical protein
MADEEHLKIIRQRVDAWNDWREKIPESKSDGHPELKLDLSGADLSEAEVDEARLIRTDLRRATLYGSYVYGAAVWDIKVDDQTKQQNLVITPFDQATITVDNIKVAQFIYLLLTNKEIRDVIDTIGSKGVLPAWSVYGG